MKALKPKIVQGKEIIIKIKTEEKVTNWFLYITSLYRLIVVVGEIRVDLNFVWLVKHNFTKFFIAKFSITISIPSAYFFHKLFVCFFVTSL